MTSNLPTLPDGWEWKKLGEVSDFQGGSQPPKKEFIYEYKDGYVRFLQIRDFSSNKNITFIPLSGKNRLCNNEDILIGRYGASVGKILTGKNGAYNVAIMKTIPNYSLIDKQFFYYYLTSELFQVPLLSTTSKRAAQDGFSKNDIDIFDIPLPPLDEQKRLVSLLDTLFAKIDRSIELLGENITAADALLPSALNTVFGELGEQWETKKLGDIATVGTGVTPLKSKHEYYENGTINWITSKATNNDFVLEAEQKISEVAMKECRLKIYSKGTLIVALYGQGKTRGQVSELMIDSTINQAIAAISVYKENSTSFIKYFFKKSYLELRDKASGGTQDNLNLSIIKSIEIPIPPLDIQNQTVKYLDSIRTKVAILKQLQNDKIANLKALKASILDRAFKGEL